MADWVIRRVADGLFWSGGGWRDGVERAWRWVQGERDEDMSRILPCDRRCQPGEEWVELDANGQPVEAKPVRKWYSSLLGAFTSLHEVRVYDGPVQGLSLNTRENVPVLVHHDGTVTLDEPAPSVAQPSPYSEDEPIPYRLTERRVYLASALPNRGRATALAAQLARDGVEIVSTWHDRDDATVEREAAVDRNELAAIAEGCLAEIDSATDLVWMHGHAEGRVGAAVEVGYALARGKRLLLLSLDGSPAPSAFGALGAAVTVSGLYRAVAR